MYIIYNRFTLLLKYAIIVIDKYAIIVIDKYAIIVIDINQKYFQIFKK